MLHGAGWQLVFERHEDRIAHRIEVQTAGGWRTLIESVEGTASAWWPSSPPLQSLHVETRSTGSVALLVGMAGRSHWSASVEIADGGAEAVFDVACRTPVTPDWLGSRYRTCGEATGADNLIGVGRHEVRFHALEQESPCFVRAAQNEIEICAVPTADRWPQTVRWRYAARIRELVSGPENTPAKPGG